MRATQPGVSWMFNHVRYAWSSGKFVVATCAPRGNYSNPGRFGYLYFKGSDELSPAEIDKQLAAFVAPPWMLPTVGGVLLHPAPGEMELTSAVTLAAARRAALQQALDRAKTAAKGVKKLAELGSDAKAISEQDSTETLDAVERLAALQADADAIHWEQAVNALIERATN